MHLLPYLALIPIALSTPTLPAQTVTVTAPCNAVSSLPSQSGPSKTCTDYTIPLTITSTNQVFAGAPFTSNVDLTDFIQNFTARVPISPPAFSANVSEDATYTLSGTFCTPATGMTGGNVNQMGDGQAYVNGGANDTTGRAKTVLFATHGLNFDRSYWDLPVESEKYSFVDEAIAQGYSVFFYDRLGVGKSQRVSGYKNQLTIQVALATALAKAIKAGQYTGAVGVPDKLVLLGHSFGSAISAAIAATEPDLAQGLVLTGFSYAGQTLMNWILASQFRIASMQRPSTWSGFDTGYVTTVDQFASQIGFFRYPDFDPSIAAYAEANKQPIAIAEVLTATGPPPLPYEFKGAAMVIAGQRDFIFCGSNCDDVIENPARQIFANAKAFQAVSYPGSGHGLNLALNAKGSFEIVLGFLNENL